MSDEKALALPTDAAKVMRDRVRAMFVDLLPQDKLDGMIKAEWDAFFKPQPNRSPSYGYSPGYNQDSNDEARWSPFELMIRRAVREALEEKIKAKLASEISSIAQGSEDGQGMLVKIAREAGPAIWEAAVAKMISDSAMVLQSHFQQIIQNMQRY